MPTAVLRFVQAMPLLAAELGAPVQALSLEEVMPTAEESGMLADGKLDFVIVTVPETATIEVYNLVVLP